MASKKRNNMAYEAGAAVDTRKCGCTLLELPPVHAGGEPSELDRFLGLGDLCAAFETDRRASVLEFNKATKQWVQREKIKRPRNCDWSFAMMEMLVDLVWQGWVPAWGVEQYERRNPDFRTLV